MLLLVKPSGKNPILARVAQIIPYNAFYTEGDPWSEARRKGLPIPEDIARRYEVCTLDLLIELPRREISYPPQPGDPVVWIDLKVHEKDIFGVSKNESGHVWFGSLSGYKEAPIPLNMENIPMHLAVFGVTGSGKSFDTGALIERFVRTPIGEKRAVSYPMVIIDAHGDYKDYVDYSEKGNKLGEEGWIRRYVFPNAYAKVSMRSSKLTSPIGINLDLISPKELAEIIILAYKGTIEGAELQIGGIDALFEHMKNEGYKLTQDLFIHYFDELRSHLDQLAQSMNMHSSTKSAIERSLDNFRAIEVKHKILSTKSELQKENFVDEITKKGGIALIDFSADGAPGISLLIKQLVMTYLATLLFEKFTEYKMHGEDRYLLFLIEEAQNFCPDKSYPVSSSLAHSKLSNIATQGRKFGLSLCLISQRPSFVDRIVLSMCNSFFIHRVSPEDVSFVRSVTGGLSASLVSRLTTLNTGEMIVTGQLTTIPFPLDIVLPYKDRKVSPTVGKTDVIKNLAKLRGLT
jgi:hypothetical protein